MRLIPLTQGQFATVLDEHYDEQNQHKWQAQWDPSAKTFYAVRSIRDHGKHRKVSMHREILKAPAGVRVDHANHCGLHNYPPNIRLATRSFNACNSRIRRDNSSGFKGVYWCPDRGLYRAQIRVNGRMISLKQCADIIEAALAYNEAAIIHFGEFAYLNVIP